MCTAELFALANERNIRDTDTISAGRKRFFVIVYWGFSFIGGTNFRRKNHMEKESKEH